METGKETNDKKHIDACKALLKSLSNAQMTMTLAPFMSTVAGADLKKDDPEIYYKLKAALREFAENMELAIPEFKRSVEEMS